MVGEDKIFATGIVNVGESSAIGMQSGYIRSIRAVTKHIMTGLPLFLSSLPAALKQ